MLGTAPANTYTQACDRLGISMQHNSTQAGPCTRGALLADVGGQPHLRYQGLHVVWVASARARLLGSQGLTHRAGTRRQGWAAQLIGSLLPPFLRLLTQLLPAPSSLLLSTHLRYLLLLLLLLRLLQMACCVLASG